MIQEGESVSFTNLVTGWFSCPRGWPTLMCIWTVLIGPSGLGREGGWKERRQDRRKGGGERRRGREGEGIWIWTWRYNLTKCSCCYLSPALYFHKQSLSWRKIPVLLSCLIIISCFLFWDRVSLCSPGFLEPTLWLYRVRVSDYRTREKTEQVRPPAED